jgi:predicted Rdx family selenoprotein
MVELFTLGNLYVSDFIKEDESRLGFKSELKMILNIETGVVMLDKTVSSDIMYSKYWYRSGINNTMKKELQSIVNSITDVVNLNSGDLWIDIACNDGTLLSYVPNNLTKIGIDPADDSFKVESENHADLIIQDYFSYDVFNKSKYGNTRAKVITTIAMFYDIENPKNFINDVFKVLDDNGIWVLQLSYTPLMIKQLAFDNICHEHIYYYSLFNIQKILKDCCIDIVDVQLNDTNGGSFRIYCMKQNSDKSKFGTQPFRDVCNFRINSVLEYEKTLNLTDREMWLNFFDKINNLKEKTVSFIKKEKSKGKKIWAYGASTKGNTLLQYFELDNTLIDGIAERSFYKFGLKTIGTNIPIFSEDDMRKVNPDYLLVLPWHFINEFVERESEFLKNGGKFIVPCPNFEVIGFK